MSDSSTLIGKRLGNYEVQSLLGSGGMASVYQGFDHNLQRQVAIKVLSNAAAAQPGLSDRFRQEARLIANLRHPHIVQVYDFGVQDGLTYMVAELLPGPSLDARIKELAARNEQFTREQIITIISHLASALDSAHAAGVIHRDVKPGNALWNASDMLVLTDFGIAREVISEVKFTQTGMIVGTPHYMSPEQAQGLPLAAASDIYSLGVVLYELVTGDVPFKGDTPMNAVIGHIQTPPPRVLPQRPELPPAVDEVMQRALAKDPAARFANAGDLARELERAWSTARPTEAKPTVTLSGQDIHNKTTAIWQDAPQQSRPAPKQPSVAAPVPQSAVPPPPPPPGQTAAHHNRAAPIREQIRERGGFPIIALVGGLLVFLLLGGLAFAMFGASGDDLEPETTPEPEVAAEVTETPVVPVEESLPPTEEPVLPTDIPPTEEPPTPEPALPAKPGGLIAFASKPNPEGNFDIFVSDADGSNPRNITNNPASNDYGPTWSPNGESIIFHSNRDGNADLYAIDVSGGNFRRITDDPGEVQEGMWSPNGGSIVFQSNRNGSWDIFTANSDGTNQRQLTSGDALDTFPTWSPDGQLIAFTSDRDGQEEIYVMGNDGNNLRNLTNHPAKDERPAWSPDGQSIAFVSFRDNQADIYVMNADGSNPRRLTTNPAQDTHPAWSSDGEAIVFTTNRDGRDELYIIGVDGENLSKISGSNAQYWDPAWSP